jgi:hypothetical protein
MMHILDNKTSMVFKEAMKQDCNLQLVLPERAIQTFELQFTCNFGMCGSKLSPIATNSTHTQSPEASKVQSSPIGI